MHHNSFTPDRHILPALNAEQHLQLAALAGNAEHLSANEYVAALDIAVRYSDAAPHQEAIAVPVTRNESTEERQGARFSTAFVFDGTIRSRHDHIPTDRKQWDTSTIEDAGRMGEENLGGLFTDVVFELEGGEMVAIRRTRDTHGITSALDQKFEYISTSAKPGTPGSRENPRPISSDMLSGIAVVPGQPIRLWSGKGDGTIGPKTRQNVASIYAVRLDNEPQAQAGYADHLPRPDKTIDVLGQFKNRIQSTEADTTRTHAAPAVGHISLKEMSAPTTTNSTEDTDSTSPIHSTISHHTVWRGSDGEDISGYGMMGYYLDSKGMDASRNLEGMPPFPVDAFEKWRAALSPRDKAKLDNLKLQAETNASLYDTIKEKIQREVPALFNAELPTELANRLGDTPYAIGFNQSATTTLDKAQTYLAENSGIDMTRYNLHHRFEMFDSGMEKDAAFHEKIEQVIVSGYSGNTQMGRFVVAFPAADWVPRKQARLSSELNSHTELLPDDFIVRHNSANSGKTRAANAKYVAGYIDDNGDFWMNTNFANTSEPDFQLYTKR